MNLFIEGFQQSGKTTLLKLSPYKYYHFPFADYVKEFDIKNKRDIFNFQLGKDLGLLYSLENAAESVIIDRGPMSSLYYSIKEKRCTLGTIKKYVEELSKYKNFKYLIVEKINEPKSILRNRKDGFDYLNDERDPEKENRMSRIIKLFKKYNIPVYYFINDFSKPIEETSQEFNQIVKGLIQ